MATPPKLADLALAVCVKFSSHITDIGDAPHEVVRPILARVSARQLLLIEERNPQIRGANDDIWRELTKKDFPERQQPRSAFRDNYFAFLKDKDDLLGAARQRLKNKQIQYAKNKVATSIVTLTDPVRPSGGGYGRSQWRSQSMRELARQVEARSRALAPRRPTLTNVKTQAEPPARNLASPVRSAPPTKVRKVDEHNPPVTSNGTIGRARSPTNPSGKRMASSVFITRR